MIGLLMYQTGRNGFTNNRYDVEEEDIYEDLLYSRPLWPFSAYAPGKNAPKQLFGGFPIEQSPEEIRLLHYRGVASGQMQQAEQEIGNLKIEIDQQIDRVVTDTRGAVRYVLAGGKEHPNRNDICDEGTAPGRRSEPQADQNPFHRGSQTSSTFGQPSASGTSAPRTGLGAPSFGQPSTSAQAPNPFSRPSPFAPSALSGQPMISGQGSSFGQPSALGQDSTFGKPPQLGRHESPFGQPSSFGNPSASGQSSSFGKPSFGQPSSSDQPSALGQPSSFGQPSTFGKPSSFGKPSFGQSSFGQPSFGQPSALQSTASPFAQANQSAQDQSPFAQPNQSTQNRSPFAQVGIGTSLAGGSRGGFGQPSSTSLNPFQLNGQISAQSAPAPETSMSDGQTQSGTSNSTYPFNPYSAANSTLPMTYGGGDTHTVSVGDEGGAGFQNPKNYSTRDASGRLLTWKGNRVVYQESDAFYKRPDDATLERIWFPDGPPGLPQDRNQTEAPPEDYVETRQELEEAYRYVREHDQFKGGDMPEEPPLTSWRRYDI
ncbi:MAG: hypothetical protein Q9165_007326 [Trypethelium subeluteriae]